MRLNDVMDFNEAGERISHITEKWNESNWEDTGFMDQQADIANKDVLALLIGITEMRNVVDLAIEKIRNYRETIKEYEQGDKGA